MKHKCTEEEMITTFWLKNLKEKHLGDLSKDQRMILKLVSEKQVPNMITRLQWLGGRPNGRFL
jgi:hypothetical protein